MSDLKNEKYLIGEVYDAAARIRSDPESVSILPSDTLCSFCKTKMQKFVYTKGVHTLVHDKCKACGAENVSLKSRIRTIEDLQIYNR